MWKDMINLLKNFGYRHKYQGTYKLDYQLNDDEDRVTRYVSIATDLVSYNLQIYFYEGGFYLGKNNYKGLTNEECYGKLELLVNGGMKVEEE